jgi:hypothetical protein
MATDRFTDESETSAEPDFGPTLPTKVIESPEPQGVVPTRSNDPDDFLRVTKVVS